MKENKSKNQLQAQTQAQPIKVRENKALQTTDGKKEIIKISQSTQIIPKVKGALANTVNKGGALCLCASTKLAETLSPIVATATQKLKNIDWEKVFLMLLAAFIEANSRKNSFNSGYGESEYYTYTEYTEVKRTAKPKTQSAKKVVPKQKQVGTQKTTMHEISGSILKFLPNKNKNKNKSITASKNNGAVTQKSNIALPKSSSNIVSIEGNAPLMLERKQQS